MMPEGPIHVATNDGFSTTLKAAASARRYSFVACQAKTSRLLAGRPDPKAAQLELELESLSKSSRAPTSPFHERNQSRSQQRSLPSGMVIACDGDHRRHRFQDGLRSPAASHRDHAHPFKAIGSFAGWRRGAYRGSKEGEAQKVIITQSGPNAFLSLADAILVKLVDAQSRRTRK